MNHLSNQIPMSLYQTLLNQLQEHVSHMPDDMLQSIARIIQYELAARLTKKLRNTSTIAALDSCLDELEDQILLKDKNISFLRASALVRKVEQDTGISADARANSLKRYGDLMLQYCDTDLQK
jgi:hypothetical protein